MCAGAQRKGRAAPRQRRQAAAPEEEEDVEAGFNPENPYQVSHTKQTCFPSPCWRPGVAACPLTSERDLRRTWRRALSHSTASGNRCRGHGAGAPGCRRKSDRTHEWVFHACIFYLKPSKALLLKFRRYE